MGEDLCGNFLFIFRECMFNLGVKVEGIGFKYN